MANLIGTAPNQVPTNGSLGTMAFQDADNANLENATIGTSFTESADNRTVYTTPVGHTSPARAELMKIGSTSIDFTLTCDNQASIWRHGYIRLTVAGGNSGDATSDVCEFLFSVRADMTNDYPIGLTQISATGESANWTVTMTNGVLNIASAQNNALAVCEFAMYTGNVSIS